MSNLKTNTFDEKYKIVSDWKFFLCEILKGASSKYIDKCVGCFDMSGISEIMPEIRDTERQLVIDELSCDILAFKMRQESVVSSYLSNVCFDEYIDLCRHHKLLRKMITAIILLMKKLQRYD